jgi:hypothetical protein
LLTVCVCLCKPDYVYMSLVMIKNMVILSQRPPVYRDHSELTHRPPQWYYVLYLLCEPPVYRDHCRLAHKFTYHFSDTSAPLYKDHLSTETTVGWPISSHTTSVIQVHLYTRTTYLQRPL